MSNKSTFLLFLLFWILLNAFTAGYTQLYADEAYYWMYSQFLDWGYFDHPPMVGLVIKLGEAFGKNEFAVRIANLLLTAASLYLIYDLVKPKNALAFSATLFAFLIFHLIGFVALPDGPFFFFSLLYLKAYRGFLKKQSLSNSLLIGILAAAMLYAKYHGGLVILCCLFAQWRVLKGYGIYLAGLTALMLLAPHIYWQYDNGFPSFVYHLVSRSSPSYKLAHTLDYLAGNLPFHGGLVALVLFAAAIAAKAKHDWGRMMKWNLYGTLIFFLFITFKGQYIEANWTIPAVFPMIFLGYKHLESNKHWSKFKILAYTFAAIMIAVRIHLLSPFAIIPNDRVLDFHRGKAFAEAVEQAAAGRYIVANRYQDASLLNFYLEEDYVIPALNIRSRANQYSLWKFEKQGCPKEIAYVNGHLNGLKIDVLHKKARISLIDSLLLPNCLPVSFETAAVTQESLTLSLSSKLSAPQLKDQLSQYILSCQLISENENAEETILEGNTFLVENERLYYRIPIPKSLNASGVHVQWISKKLDGGNNEVVRLRLEE